MERILEDSRLTLYKSSLKREVREAMEFFIKAGAVSPENKWRRGIKFTGPWASRNYGYNLNVLHGLCDIGILERRNVGETNQCEYRIADIEIANEILNYDNFI